VRLPRGVPTVLAIHDWETRADTTQRRPSGDESPREHRLCGPMSDDLNVTHQSQLSHDDENETRADSLEPPSVGRLLVLMHRTRESNRLLVRMQVLC
jgi:hypothetical protein